MVFSLRRDEDLEGQERTPDDAPVVKYVTPQPPAKLSTAKKWYSEAGQGTGDGEAAPSADPSGPTSSGFDSKRPDSISTEYYIPPPLERDNGKSRYLGSCCGHHMPFMEV